MFSLENDGLVLALKPSCHAFLKFGKGNEPATALSEIIRISKS